MGHVGVGVGHAGVVFSYENEKAIKLIDLFVGLHHFNDTI